MTKDTFSFASATGQHTLHGVCWRPEGAPRAIVQISHGMIEYVERYEPFAQYLTEQGFLVAGHDHVGHGQSVAGPEQWGHFGVRDAGATLVEDVHALTVQLREQYPGVPLFLLGHSMGSFVFPHLGFTWQHSALITPLCYLVEVVPDPLQLRDKFFDTVRIHDLLLQHTGKDILLLVLPALENLLLQLLVFFLVYPER